MAGIYSFNENDIVFKVYTFNTRFENYSFSKISFIKDIFFRDIINSEMKINFFEPNELIVKLKNYELFEELLNIYNESGLVFERVIHKEANYQENKFNKIFFINKINFKSSEFNYEITGLDWKHFESKKIVNHNVFFNNLTLPVDEDGDKYFPEEFNKYRNNTQNQTNLIKDILKRSILEPFYNVKGNDPREIYTATNGINLFSKFYWLNDIIVEDYGISNDKIYTFLKEKASVTGFKSDIYNFYGINNFCVHRVESELSNDNLTLFYKKNNNIIIDNFYNEDKLIDFTFEIDDQNLVNESFSESSSDDFLGAQYSNNSLQNTNSFQNIKIGRLGTGEPLSVSIAEENNSDWFNFLNSKNEELINSNITKKSYSLEIEFRDKYFLKDFDVCDIIELVNFEEIINGRYLIKSISEIIEDNYITYAIEDMQKLV